jgi:ADP-ribose pyrophosphatase
MKSAIAGYFSHKDSEKIIKCSQENIPKNLILNKNYIQFGNIKIHTLPIYVSPYNHTIASLKFPCEAAELYLDNESPLANIKLPIKISKPKNKTTRNKSSLEYKGQIRGEENVFMNAPSSHIDDTIDIDDFRRSSISSYYGEDLNIYCRNQKYPQTYIERYPVPEEKLKFDVKYREYENYLIPLIDISKDLIVLNSNTYVDQSAFLEYNESTANNSKNPVGRTGIIGKGLLKNYGANRFAFMVITKYKRSSSGAIKFGPRDSSPKFQFLAFKYKDFDNKWAIPGGSFDNDDFYLYGLPKSYSKNMILKKEKLEYLYNLYRELFISPLSVFSGYLDDYANTDDAWIEAVAENYHHESDDVPRKLMNALFDAEMNPDDIKFEWVDFKDKNIYLPHKIILFFTKKAHSLHKAMSN